ncbi:hypothetical protein [Paenibacillus sp. N3.4]|uniref:hypothetical protein n=1 Tax=Paenibacillus sp. N3.4 TaxID=2603222 RepID=UPI0011CA1C80|nr:hypothetical protein [Paenibacillus sp. N3.4]TXK85127.1 hypothetical protein FU659_05115 [Paenibacillus sp. N3.4]
MGFNSFVLVDISQNVDLIYLEEVMMGDFSFNMNYENRDKLLGISGEWIFKRGSGSIRRFDFIDVSILKQLIENKFIDPIESHNSSPSIEQIYGFMARFPHVMAKGYVTSPLRIDYRVSLDALFVPKKHITQQLKQDFIAFCVKADELETDEYLYAWWD